MADKGASDETYTAESIALIRISGTSIHNNKSVQVDAVCTHESIPYFSSTSMLVGFIFFF